MVPLRTLDDYLSTYCGECTKPFGDHVSKPQGGLKCPFEPTDWRPCTQEALLCFWELPRASEVIAAVRRDIMADYSAIYSSSSLRASEPLKQHFEALLKELRALCQHDERGPGRHGGTICHSCGEAVPP